jgi:hypothetical protein
LYILSLSGLGFRLQSLCELKRDWDHSIRRLKTSLRVSLHGVDKDWKGRLEEDKTLLGRVKGVNLCIKEQKVTLTHFQRALELTHDQDYQITNDLKVAYHHIKIHPSHTKFLGAAIPKPNGEKQYLIFLSLPFRLSSAVTASRRLLSQLTLIYMRMKYVIRFIWTMANSWQLQSVKQKSTEFLSTMSYKSPDLLLRQINLIKKVTRANPKSI